MTTTRRIHVGPEVCTRDIGHDGPCNGIARRSEDGSLCWALRSLSTTRKLTSCTLNAGHSGSCNGVSRMVGAGWCWDLAEQRREAQLKAHTLYVAFVDEIPSLTTEPHEIAEEISAPEVVKMWDALKTRITDLEADNTRLRTRVNELLSMTASNH